MSEGGAAQPAGRGQLSTLRRSRAQRIALIGAALVLGVVGFFPLFGGPGYESALAAGLLLPAIAAVVTAIETSAARPEPLDALGRGLTAGALLALAGLAVTLLHGLRAGFCDPLNGVALYALMGGAGAVMGGAWGALAGFFAERRQSPRRRIALAVALALVGPLVGIVVSLARFYTSPMVFGFDPFFGYFAGPLYDTVVDPLERLLSYRLGSLATLVATSCLAFHLSRESSGPMRIGWRGRPGIAMLGALAAALSLALTVAGPELGHYQTLGTTREALGRSLDQGRCRVIYSRNLLDRDARLVARECVAHLQRLERWFGAPGPDQVQVFLFASTHEKAWLMGAAQTQIAKPWRREVYVQAQPYPHPVLGHELAHVVAGAFGVGPFRIAGPLSGWLPDPGRIEGVATAATTSLGSELGLQEWARTLQKLDLLPPLSSVFRLSFLGENASTAYTVAGAFIEWLRERHGPAVVRGWYAGIELGTLTGSNFGALADEWQRSLARIAVSPQALSAARVRFDRPAIFGRRCPRVVDLLAEQAASALAMGNWRDARDAYTELLALDPHHVGARLGLGTCALRAFDLEGATARFQAISRDPALARLQRAAGEEALADLDLWAGRINEASARYAELEKLHAAEDALRAIEVKRTPPTPLAREAIVALLIGHPVFGASFEIAAERLARWSERDPERGEADYLLGRNLYQRGRWREAAAHLSQALSRRIESDRVRREAYATHAIVSCALSDFASAAAALRAWQSQPGLTTVQRAAMADFAERCGIGAE